MEVLTKDRKQEIEFLRIALNACEIYVNYTQADLILRVQGNLNKLEGKFSIQDAANILSHWKEDWNNYFNKLSKEIKQ